VTLVVSSFAKVGKHIESFYDMVAAGDKVAELLDISEVGGGPSDVYMPSEELHGAGLCFDEVELVRGRLSRPVAFTIEPGTAVAIRGRSGVGKSTLVQALSAPELLAKGEIRIDGVPNVSLDPSERYDRIEVVGSSRRFFGSIMDHLRAGALFVEHAEAASLLDDLGLTARIRALPDGFDTALEADGHPLSETETVMIDLARAVLRQPDVLVLDGILDALAPDDVEVLLEFSRTHCAHATLLVTTRNPTVSARFDREFEL